jgi:hypothetical protein
MWPLLAALLLPQASSLLATIHNDIPRVDLDGHILDAHDGSVLLHNNTYYLYGTVYENCTQAGTQCNGKCGYSPNTFAVYTSPDLMAWTLVSSNILPQQSKDNELINYWMPVVAHNALTNTFVMQYWSSHCGFSKPCADIAVSASPVGPFTNAPQPLALHSGTPSSQMGFFVDPDTGRGYVKYNTGAPQHHAVEALSEDWLSTTGEVAILLWKPTFAWMEGGGMFKQGQLYYYMTGTDCCVLSPQLPQRL